MAGRGGFFEERSLGEVVHTKRKLVSAPSDMHVAEALRLMQRKNVRVLPVTSSSSASPNEFLGMVDLLDVLVPLAFAGYFKTQSFEEAEFSAFKVLENVKLGDLIGVSEEGKQLWTVPSTTSLAEALFKFSHGVHRILVQLPSGEVRLCSQTDVIRFLLKHQSHRDLAPLFQKTIKELGLGTPSPKSITTKDIALEAFRTIVQSNVSGLAVVNEDGSLAGSISTKDVRGITTDNLHNVTKPVLEFQEAIEGGAPAFPVVCNEDEALSLLLLKTIAHGTHRAYLVEKQSQAPVAAITFSDVLAKFETLLTN
ncbi:hypothetical protein QOT17_004589 [Balamuthia mandrillaris]